MKQWDDSDLQLGAREVATAYLRTTTLSEGLIALGSLIAKLARTNPREAKRMFNEVTVEFDDPLDLLQWRQFGALFLKSTDGGSPAERREAAIQAFISSEERCRETNHLHEYYWLAPNKERPMMRVVLSRARELIHRVVGEFTPAAFRDILAAAKPGPGSCAGTKGVKRTSLPFKLGECELTVTADALPWARLLVETSDVWMSLISPNGEPVRYTIVPGDRPAFVPKDMGIERGIFIGPLLNVMLQLGVHARWLRQLKRVGVTLNDQSPNQEAARRGAADWLGLDPYVTLDLSQASDSVAYWIVKRLLPTSWVLFLDDIRSKEHGVAGCRSRHYEKWSAMGNGYTFALESLIFWALAEACRSITGAQDRVVIYGDDIAVPRSVSGLLIETLEHCGFRLNLDKSFVFGPFRESCGHDWFGENFVTPVYLRELRKLAPTDTYRLVNGLRRLGLHSNQVESLVKAAHRRADIPVLYGVDAGDGDESSCWFVPVEKLHEKAKRWSKDLQCWVTRVARFQPSCVDVPQAWTYAAALCGAKGPDVTIRDSRSTHWAPIAETFSILRAPLTCTDFQLVQELQAIKPARGILRSTGRYEATWAPARAYGWGSPG